jgi:hypothetical protein
LRPAKATGNPTVPTVKRFLDRLAAQGFNHILVNVFAYDTGWRAGKTGDDDYGPPPLSPWAGAIDAPQHDQLNLAFWQHYDRIVRELAARGLNAHIMLKVYNKKVRWPERGTPADDLYFRTIAARYAAFPNLVRDFSKEAHNEKDLAYMQGRMRFMRENDPYRHLATVHDDDANNDAGAWDELTDFRTDRQHSKFREKILAQRTRRAGPVANVEFGYEQGPLGPEDKTYRSAQPSEEFVTRAWEVAMAGGYTAYYYTYTAWDVIRPDDQPKGYTYFKLLRAFFETTRYWEMAPAGRWSSTFSGAGRTRELSRLSLPGAVAAHASRSPFNSDKSTSPGTPNGAALTEPIASLPSRRLSRG